MDEFAAHQDRFVQTVTVLTFVLFAILLLAFASADNTAGLISVAAIGLPLFLMCNLLVPRGYSISESEVIIRRRIGAVKIPLAIIRAVRQDTSACSFWGVRTFGVAGIYGYFGRFYSRELGHYHMYATDYQKAVVIEADKIYVISPDDPQQFVLIARARLEAQNS
jgi:hypothetical protein